MYLEPNGAFCFALIGTLLIYVELVRPGRVLLGITGVLLLFYACGSLGQHRPALAGIVSVFCAAVLYATDALVETYSMAGIVATLVLAVGLLRLFPSDPRISTLLAITGSLLLGMATVALAFVARKARRNKRSDLA